MFSSQNLWNLPKSLWIWENTLHDLQSAKGEFVLCVSRIKSAFEAKQKAFFCFVSKVLSFRHAKQPSKNIADITLKQQ